MFTPQEVDFLHTAVGLVAENTGGRMVMAKRGTIDLLAWTDDEIELLLRVI